MTKTFSCPLCGRMRNVELDARAVNDWLAGASVGKAFPTLPECDRDALNELRWGLNPAVIDRAYCGECWQEYFAGRLR